MIEIDDKIVSADLFARVFRLRHRAVQRDLCCVEGNAGAPLEVDEVEILEREYSNYKPYMTAEGIESVERQGFMVVDEDGDLTTPLVDDAQCAYTYTENGVTLCAIEKSVGRGQNPVPQADFVPPLSDPRDALLERHGGAQLPPLVGVRSGPPVRRQAGHSGLQSPPGTDRPPFRRGIHKALEAAEELIKQQ